MEEESAPPMLIFRLNPGAELRGIRLPIRESDLNNSHSFFLPHENKNDSNSREILKNSDLVIAEVSFPSTGQGIEMGWANILKIPILCVFKEGSKISASLKYITDNLITYKDSRDLITEISKFLSQ